MATLISAMGFGCVTAAILAIAAVGFTLQFSVTNVFNLAFGSVMTTCGFVAYAVNSHGINIWICVLIAAGAGGLMSLGLNSLLYGRFIRHGTDLFGMVIVTIATGLIIDRTIQGVVGPGFFSYTVGNSRALRFADFVLTPEQIATIVLALAAMGAIHWLLRYTRVGKSMRALASNASLARACGIPTRRIIGIAWVTSGLLGGAAGVLLFIDTTTFSATSGSGFLIVVIAAAVVGGIGSPYGAMAGALLVGVTSEVAAAYWNPELKDVVAFGLLVIVLLVRPRGIFAEVATEKDVVG
jgi:branched-chain amino acid transport system permease protein/neutral amino acid transport system permease protein